MRHAIILLIAGLAACRPHGPPPPAPEPRPIEVLLPPPPQPILPPEVEVRVCVLRGASLIEASAFYTEATGDTVVDGESIRDSSAANDALARNAAWYINNEPIAYREHLYVKYGLPHVLKPGDVVHDGDLGGMPVFIEPGSDHEVIYVPVTVRCEFQPYVYRGIK